MSGEYAYAEELLRQAQAREAELLKEQETALQFLREAQTRVHQVCASLEAVRVAKSLLSIPAKRDGEGNLVFGKD